MTESYIDAVIRRICNREGGYTNDPADAGGPTKYGITQATLSAWRKQPVTANDVKLLTLEEACQIYKAVYVIKPGYLLLQDEPLAEQLIDAGVNHGSDTAIRMLQKVVGTTVDGQIGKNTKAKYDEMKPSWKVFSKFMARRLALYKSIIQNKSTQAKFAAGWMNRCAEMIDIYVAAVEIDPAIEHEMLLVSGLARKQANDIQKSATVRKQSPELFGKLSTKMNSI